MPSKKQRARQRKAAKAAAAPAVQRRRVWRRAGGPTAVSGHAVRAQAMKECDRMENRRDCPCGPVERNDWPRWATVPTAPTPGRGAEERASAEAAAAPALQRRQLLVGAGDLAAATGNPVRTRVTLASGFDGEPPRLESVHEGRHDSPCRGPLRTGFTAACRAPENTSRTRRPQLHAVLVRRRRGAGSRTRSRSGLWASCSVRSRSRGR